MLVATGTILSCCAMDREARWTMPLWTPWGPILFLCIVLPWFSAILIATDGEIPAESVGKDPLAKVTGGRESHGAPPGYFAFAFWLTFWPWSLMARVAATCARRHRSQPATRFCLAWIVSVWLVFEIPRPSFRVVPGSPRPRPRARARLPLFQGGGGRG